MFLHYIIDNEPEWDSEMMGRRLARNYQPLEFDYDVDITFDDFFEFIQPKDFKTWHEEGQKCYKQAVLDIWDNDFLNWEFEEDEDFIEFMKDKYYDEAYDWYLNGL